MINSTGSARDLLAKLPRVNYMRPVSIDLQKLLRIGFVEEPNPDVPTVDLAGHEPNGCATFCHEAAPNGCGDPQQQQYCKNLRDSDVFVLGEGERNHAYTVSFASPAVTSSPGGYRVSNFTLWSANAGAITSGGIGHLSATGSDTLRVGATMTVPAGVRPTEFTAVVPITIVAQ